MNSFNGIKIMLVDDEPHILQFLELGLQGEGFEVECASDGAGAIRAAERTRPQVIVLDVMMPGMGLRCAGSLNKAAPTPPSSCLRPRMKSPTGSGDWRRGADDYMIKPFSFDELLARINARLRNQFPSLLGEVCHGPFRIDVSRTRSYHHAFHRAGA